MRAVLDKTTETTTAGGAARRGTFTFNAVDVTGTRNLTASFQPTIPAGHVATTLANRMALPQNVPWALRDDSTGSYLDPEQEIGSQIKEGSSVSVTPKTHLG